MSECSKEKDAGMRQAAFAQVKALMSMQGYLSKEDIHGGFEFENKRIRLVDIRKGIWKPKEMRYVLSIRTSLARSGKESQYGDQEVSLERLEQFLKGEESIEYSFQGKDPMAYTNQWLRFAYEEGVPLIYFLGLAPNRTFAAFPIFIENWDAKRCMCILRCDVGNEFISSEEEQREETLRMTRVRLYQDRFREILLCAYDRKCAFSGFPEP